MSINKDTKYKEYFYRYRHFDDTNCIEALEKLFLEHKIYVASPLSFNDPYDCRAKYVIDGTDREVRAYLKKIYNSNGGNAAKNEVNRAVIKAMRKLRKGILNAADLYGEEHHKALLQRVGMICLAKTSDNILMWSHYASSHKGICLQFEATTSVESIFMLAQKVEYSEKYPEINLVKCTDLEKLSKGLLTKALDWKYECEYRIIIPEAPKQMQFPEKSLKGVILGLRTSLEHKKLVMGWIERRKVKPAVYQAEKKRNEFGLVFKKLLI